MEQASLIIGNGNWAVKSGSLLGYTMFNEQFYPQYVTASRATTSTRVDENGLIVTSSIGIARIDYSTGEAALLVEPQRTNLLTYSEDFGVWGITPAGISSIEPNYAISPEGVENAYKVNFVVQGDSDLALVKGHSVTGGSTYAYSIYIKGEGSDIGKDIVVKSKRSGGGDSAGTTTTQTLTGEWVRVDFTTTYAANNTAASFYISSNDATSCLIYGAQAEEGSYATSYIPTYGTSVTRNAEQYDKVITSLVPDATTFTWEVDFIVPEFAGGGGEFFGRNAAGTIQLRLYANNNGIIRFRVESGPQNYDTAVSVGDTAKCIFRCSSGVVSAFYNGVKIHTFTGVTMDFGKISFGIPVTSPKIIRSLVFPTALTDAECIDLTTI